MILTSHLPFSIFLLCLALLLVLCLCLAENDDESTQNTNSESVPKPVSPEVVQALAELADINVNDLPPLIWSAPFFSGGGYCSEAIAFIFALADLLPADKLAIRQHGDSMSQPFFFGLSNEARTRLLTIAGGAVEEKDAVVICHSEPGAWYPPKYQTSRCPPAEVSVRVGRTMFETDRLPEGWAQRINVMDFVWVPAHFFVPIFEAAGVKKDKIRVIGEAVDTDFFSRERWESELEKMPKLRVILNDEREKQQTEEKNENDEKDENVEENEVQESAVEEMKEYVRPFRFLSIFKFEDRKGWKYLLEAYWKEFLPKEGEKKENVALYILTSAYHSDNNFNVTIDEFKNSLSFTPTQMKRLPRFYLITEHVPSFQLPGLYYEVDAFVLPSMGEGWGRPHAEAMAMSLPVIATNWSGTTEFLRDDNSYPIPMEKLVSIPSGPFRGHKRAKPSLSKLREALRRVKENKEEREEKGRKAREEMVEKWCPLCVAKKVLRELHEIQKWKKIQDENKKTQHDEL